MIKKITRVIGMICLSLILSNSYGQVVFQKSADGFPNGTYTLDQVKSDFNTTWANGFEKNGEGENRVTVINSPSPESGKCLKVKYPKDNHDSKYSGAQWETNLGGGYTELYMSYDVRFESGFSLDKNGKLPGLAGGLSFDDDDDDNTAWDGKLMWRTGGKLEFYLKQPINSDKHFAWTKDGEQATVVANKWYNIEIHYKMNTAGSNNGLMEAWLDGELVARYSNFGLFRNNNSVKIYKMFFSTFFGGNESDDPPVDNYALFDNFVVSTERIGTDGGSGGGGEPVNQKPTVNITSPSNNASYTEGANITIKADASDSDGTVKRVEFYNNGTKIGTDYSDPFSYTINSAVAGSYTLTAKAVDDDNETKTSSAITVNVNSSGGSTQSAYPSGVPHPIPGTIKSINYDNGGEGVAYHDASSGNAGSGPRQDENVDLGSSNVGWISTGEWLEYTVDVESGTYDIAVQVASNTSYGKFHIEFNGTDKTGVKTVNNTGGWGTYYTISISDVSLSGGEQVMRVYMDGKSFNLKNIVFTKQDEGSTGGGSAGGDCGFSVPASSKLKSYDDVTFNNIHVLGSGGPSLSNVTKLRVNYDASANNVKRFAFNTSNGVPSYYNDLRSSMDHGFGKSSPDVTISGSGFSGFDGSYWVTSDGDNFVMVSKSDEYAIYFSNSSTAPDCDPFKSAQGFESELTEVTIYPNPVTNNYLIIEGLAEVGAQVIITNMLGKTVLVKNITSSEDILDVGKLKAGSYILIVRGENTQTSKLFNKL